MSDFPSEFSSADESPGFLLWQVCTLWQRKQREALLPLKLTHVQFVLLTCISYFALGEKPLSQKELSFHAKTDPMMTSEVVRTLEKKGLVKRSSHPKDSRAFSLSATKAGKNLVEKALKVVEKVDRDFFAPLSAQEDQFIKHLSKLRG